MEEVTSRKRLGVEDDEVHEDKVTVESEDEMYEDEDEMYEDEDEMYEDEDESESESEDEMTDEDKEKLISKTRQELEPMLEKLEQELKEHPKLDLVDILFSKRFRQSVLHILDWMFIHDFARVAHVVYPEDAMEQLGYPEDAMEPMEYPEDAMEPMEYDPSASDITLLRREISSLAKYIRRKHDPDRLSNMHDLDRRYLFYPLDYLCFSHDKADLEKDVAGLDPRAFSPLVLYKRVDNDVMDSRALNVRSLFRECRLTRNWRTPLVTSSRPQAYWRTPLVTSSLHQASRRLRNFRGKYVLVCCINVPGIFGSVDIQSLFNLCHELSSLKRWKVEIVIVARIHILFDVPDLFQHLLKKLPTSCLVVPHESWEERERIHKELGFDIGEEFKVFVYNRNGSFSSTFLANAYENPYGAEVFPFTKEMVEKVQRERVALREEGSLVELLRPSYEGYPKQDVVVYEFNQGEDGPKQPISQVIENRHVGLYVCCEGNLIPLLHELYEQCKERMDPDRFEIVVLYVPPQCNDDPDTFKKEIDGLLQKHEGGGHGWWCLPFNHSVSLRFFGLTMDYNTGLSGYMEDSEDKLIIVGPDGKILDMYGAHVIKSHGIDGNYPFTRAAYVEKRMSELRSGERLLEPLLEAQLFRGTDPDTKIPGSALLNRKVIIYMGDALDYTANGRNEFETLVPQYKKMKKDLGDDEFEVVFVEYPLAYRKKATEDITVFRGMPWYVHCPVNGSYTDLARQLRETVGQEQALIGFDEDGRICSYKLIYRLKRSTGLCLDDTLFDDLYGFYGFNKYCKI